jgi:hypothetical protein
VTDGNRSGRERARVMQVLLAFPLAAGLGFGGTIAVRHYLADGRHAAPATSGPRAPVSEPDRHNLPARALRGRTA